MTDWYEVSSDGTDHPAQAGTRQEVGQTKILVIGWPTGKLIKSIFWQIFEDIFFINKTSQREFRQNLLIKALVTVDVDVDAVVDVDADAIVAAVFKGRNFIASDQGFLAALIVGTCFL